MNEENAIPNTETAEAPVAELNAADDAVTSAENPTESAEETQKLLASISALEAELMKERIKVKLLTLGILPEKLEDGAAMAYGLYLAGKTSDGAAEEIIAAYPHLKVVRRELPQFAAESAGSGDGFSAIRRIFSAR